MQESDSLEQMIESRVDFHRKKKEHMMQILEHFSLSRINFAVPGDYDIRFLKFRAIYEHRHANHERTNETEVVRLLPNMPIAKVYYAGDEIPPNGRSLGIIDLRLPSKTYNIEVYFNELIIPKIAHILGR